MNLFSTLTSLLFVVLVSVPTAFANSDTPNTAQARSPQITHVRVGSTQVAIPVPLGHVGGDKVPMHLRRDTPQNDVLAVFIRYVDYVLASKGIPTGFKSVYRVEILRRAIDIRVSRSELEELKRDLRKDFVQKHLPDLTAKTNKEYREHKTKELADIVGTKIDQISIGQPVMLGLVDESDDWVSIALLSKVQFDTQGGQASAIVVFTLTTALVKGKMLTLIVMRPYENPDDLENLLDSSKQWIRDIAKLN